MLSDLRPDESGQAALKHFYLAPGQQQSPVECQCCLLVSAVLRYRTDMSSEVVQRDLVLSFPLTATGDQPDWAAATEINAQTLAPVHENPDFQNASEVGLVSRQKESWEHDLREWLQTHGTIPLWKNEYFGMVSALTEPFEAFQQRVVAACQGRKTQLIASACDRLEQKITRIESEQALNNRRFVHLRRLLSGTRDLTRQSFQETANIMSRLHNELDQCDTMARIGSQIFACRPSREHMHVVIIGLGWPEAELSRVAD